MPLRGLRQPQDYLTCLQKNTGGDYSGYWACRLETPHTPALHVGAKETFLEYMPLHVLDRGRKSGLIIGFEM